MDEHDCLDISPPLTDFNFPAREVGTAIILKRTNRRTWVDHVAIVSYDDRIGNVTLISANPIK